MKYIDFSNLVTTENHSISACRKEVAQFLRMTKNVQKLIGMDIPTLTKMNEKAQQLQRDIVLYEKPTGYTFDKFKTGYVEDEWI